MEQKTVLVTGIGGNVGQGIIRNIRETKFPIVVVGCNVTEFSAGNYLCDSFEKVPYAFESGYISAIKNVVTRHNVELILPSTDYEMFYLAKYQNELFCTVACSNIEAAEIYLDKWKTWQHHNANDIPFAASVLPSQFNNQFSKYILKPRKGRGSRGIFVNHEKPNVFADEEYLVQELAEGKEITTAFYVTKENELNGLITMERTLENGTTNFSKVVFAYDEQIVSGIILPMMKVAPLRGSVNVQSIVTSENKIVPFEVNCRISGTNSIRTNFGFRDVKYTLQEYLYNQLPEKPKVTDGIAVRVYLDVVYPNAKDIQFILDNKANYRIF